MNNEEIGMKIAEHEQRIIGSEHRIKDLEEESKQMHDLVLSVNKLAINMESMLSELKDQSARLQKLENEPAERWNSAKKTAFTTIISVMAGALATGVIMMIAQYINF